MRKIRLFLSYVLFLGVFINAPHADASSNNLDEILGKYRSTLFAEIELKKIIKSELLGTTKEYLAKVYLSLNKFRFETEKPERNIVVFDGSNVWTAQFPPEEIGGSVQVSKQKIDRTKKSPAPLITLLHPGKHRDNFNLLSNKQGPDRTIFKLVPKDKDSHLQVITVTVNSKSKEIEQIAYSDEVGNETTLIFQKTVFSKKLEKKNKSKFKFIVPKNAKVTEL